MGEIILVGSLWLGAFAALVIINIIRLEDNTRVMREVQAHIKRRKSCNESLEASERRDDRAVIVPPSPALSSGAVAAASLRSVPSVPYVGADADDREPPEHSEVQGESRIRARARHDTAGSWVPKDPDNAAERATRRLPRVAIVNAENEDRTDKQGLPACSSCGSIDVQPQSGMFACNSCGKLGALRRASIAPPPDSPHLSA